jgi:hypothetical protein
MGTLNAFHVDAYLINPLKLVVNNFTAIAVKSTPKNLRIAVNPPVPNNLAI